MSQDYQVISALLDAGQWSRAEPLIRSELKREPHEPWLITSLALCLINTGREGGAADLAKQAIGFDPESHFAHFLLGKALPSTRHYGRSEYLKLLYAAREHLKEAIRLGHEHAQYHAGLAQNWMLVHDEKRAIDAARSGLSVSPFDVECRLVLARALIATGKQKEADQVLLEALAQAPDDATAHAHRGWGLLAGGKHREARDHFEESLRLYPNSGWARVGLQESLKRCYWPYRWSARGLTWLARRDTTNSRHISFIMGAYLFSVLLVSIIGTVAGLIFRDGGMSSLHVGSIFLFSCFGMLPFVVIWGLVPTFARWLQDFAAWLLMLNRSGRRTLLDRQRMGLLMIPVLMGWLALMAVVFSFLPESVWGIALMSAPIVPAMLALAGPWRHRLIRHFWIGLLVSFTLIAAGVCPFWVVGPGLHALLVPLGYAVLFIPVVSLQRALDRPV